MLNWLKNLFGSSEQEQVITFQEVETALSKGEPVVIGSKVIQARQDRFGSTHYRVEETGRGKAGVLYEGSNLRMALTHVRGKP